MKKPPHRRPHRALLFMTKSLPPTNDPFDFYTERLKFPLADFLAELPRGKELKDRLMKDLPPRPDDRVRALPLRKRLTLLTILKELHVVTGRDIALSDYLFEMLEDSYALRPFTGERLQRDYDALESFASAVATTSDAMMSEPLGGSLVGMSGTGKTHTVTRLFSYIPQVVKGKPSEHPLLPPLIILWLLVECPANRSLTALITAIFKSIETATGKPIPKEFKRGNESQLIESIGTLCSHFCVGVLAVDEIQHALNGNGRPDQEFLNFFVQLGNTLKVPVLLIGTPLARRVVGGAMRQARRMIGPEWLNMKRDSTAWKEFSTVVTSYQFSKTVVSYESVEPALYRYSQGLPGLAITLWRVSQRIALHLEQQEGGDTGVTTAIIEAVYADYFSTVHPMVEAIRSGDLKLMEIYQDLHIDPEALERQLAEDAKKHEEALRAELYKTRRSAVKKAKKIIKHQVDQQIRMVTPPPPTDQPHRPMLDAFDQAKKAGGDPGAAVASTR